MADVDHSSLSIVPLLSALTQNGGSDLYLTVDSFPLCRLSGNTTPIESTSLSADIIDRLVKQTAPTDAHYQTFLETREGNWAYTSPTGQRFRVNAYFQRGCPAMVVRHIKTEIPTLDSLSLPKAIQTLAMAPRGLVLCVGATGSGKSTTLAAMIDERNKHSRGHIVTIEDPIEFIHAHQGCVVSQREVGMDTPSFESAIENALRQAPDVVLIGEIRNAETMAHALSFAETGHLCLATLHANNANQAIDRILHLFPDEKRKQVLLDLSFNLRGIISQRLVPTVDNQRIAAIEILLGSPLVQQRLLQDELDELKPAMEKSREAGMQTFDQALIELTLAKLISEDTALRFADSANNVRLAFKLQQKTTSKESELEVESPSHATHSADAATSFQESQSELASPSKPVAMDSNAFQLKSL